MVVGGCVRALPRRQRRWQTLDECSSPALSAGDVRRLIRKAVHPGRLGGASKQKPQSTAQCKRHTTTGMKSARRWALAADDWGSSLLGILAKTVITPAGFFSLSVEIVLSVLGDIGLYCTLLYFAHLLLFGCCFSCVHIAYLLLETPEAIQGK